MVNTYQNDWDVMLFIDLRAYWIAYKVIIQATPFQLVYGTQPTMPATFMLTHKIQNVLEDDIQLAIWVRMEELVKLDENCWHAKKIWTIFNYYENTNKMINATCVLILIFMNAL
jgi:hypothetical protein